MTQKERYRNILEYFGNTQPDIDTELEYSSTFQLLVAVVLSAQCTDKRVNMVTPALFSAYPTPQAMSSADEEDILHYIKSVSYPQSKSKYLASLSRMLVNEYGGKVPADINKLTKLPGVGRKTANVIMAVAFKQSAMPVDTHVYRVSHRLGLVSPRHNTPYKVEVELKKHIPDALMSKAHHWLLLHGRYICKSANPMCSKCQFDTFCPKKLTGSKLE